VRLPLHYRFSRVQVSDQTRQQANRVKIRFGPTGSFLTRQEWIADGVETSWTTDIAAVNPPPALVLIDDGVTPYLATVGSGAMYEWDQATHTLSLGTDALPALGTRIVLGPSTDYGDPYTTDGFTGQYPFLIVLPVVDPAPPIKTYRGTSAESEYGPALEVATQLLAALDRANVRQLDISTDEDGFDVGQSLTVNTVARGGVVSTFLIGSISIQMVRGDYWDYSFTATEGIEPQMTPQAEWRQLVKSGSSSGGAVAVSSGGGSSATVGIGKVVLGGSDFADVPMDDSVPAYTDIRNCDPFVARSSFTALVRAWIWARAGGAVTMRLRNITDSTTVGSASNTASAKPSSPQTFNAVIEEGKEYRAQAIGAAGDGVYVMSSLEAA
jgi:hypothetical protein